MNCHIIKFDHSHKSLLPHQEEPFEVIGRLMIRFDGVEWSTSEVINEQTEQKTYQDDVFDAEEYLHNPDQAAFLAMCGNQRIGSIRVSKKWNGNAFVDDIKVNQLYRRCGIGKMLVDAAVHWAKENGLNGLSLETQDDNIPAYIEIIFHLILRHLPNALHPFRYRR